MEMLKRKFYKYGLLMILIVGLALNIQYKHFNKYIVNSKKENILESRQHLKEHIEDKLEYYGQYVEFVEDFLKSESTNEQLDIFLNNINQTESNIRTIYFVTKDNDIIFSGDWEFPDGYDPRTREWYIKAVKNKGLIITDVYLDIAGKEELITLSKPVYDVDGSFMGVIAEDIRIEQVVDIIENAKIKGLGKSFLIDKNKKILANPIYKDKLEKEFLNSKLLYENLFNIAETRDLKEYTLAGVPGYLSYDLLENTGWIVGNFISLDDFKGGNTDALQMAFIAIVIAILIIVILSYILRIYIIKPFVRFYEDVLKINPQGNKGYRLPIYEKDPFLDIRKLANTTIESEEKLVEQHQQDTEEIIAQNEELNDSYDKLKEMEYKLRDLSYKDKLTGLYNRRYFEEQLKELDLEEKLPISIIMADINGLKLINDSFGHDIGDELISTVGRIIKLGVREGDMVSRISGDEFIVVLPKTDKSSAMKVLSRIKTISKNTALENAEIPDMELSASFGVATKYKVETDIQYILKKAEEKMYRYKLFEGSSMKRRTIDSMIRSLHEKSNSTRDTALKVSKYGVLLGKELGLSEEDLKNIEGASCLSDIGKITIPDDLLRKEGRLSKKEIELIKKHPEIGYRILNTIDEMNEIAKFVLYHHERYDGNGYPKGLKGEEIPLISRILNIATSYVNMTTEKPYRKALSQDEVVKEFKDKSGTQFDPKLAKIFVEEVLQYK